MRLPRYTDIKRAASYTLSARSVGGLSDQPLKDPTCAEELRRLCQFYTRAYQCRPGALQILPEQFHLPVQFDAYRPLSQSDLMAFIPLFYPGRYRPWKKWGSAEWARFNRRIFNPSELMRNILMAFAVWYNKRNSRRGAFWAGRHASTVTDNLREAVLYVELAAVRRGLVQQAEDWEWGSAKMRKEGTDKWLIALEELLVKPDRTQALRAYWKDLAWRGSKPGSDGDPLMPAQWIRELEAETRRAQLERGAYLSQIPAITYGRAVGSRQLVERRLAEFQKEGALLNRSEPIPLGFAALFSLLAPKPQEP